MAKQWKPRKSAVPPVVVPEETLFRFLDQVRESGAVNMFGAGPVLSDVFGLNRQQARETLSKWMETFEARHLKKSEVCPM